MSQNQAKLERETKIFKIAKDMMEEENESSSSMRKHEINDANVIQYIRSFMAGK